MGIYDGLLRVYRNLRLVHMNLRLVHMNLRLVHMNLRLVHMNALCFSSKVIQCIVFSIIGHLTDYALLFPVGVGTGFLTLTRLKGKSLEPLILT